MIAAVMWTTIIAALAVWVLASAASGSELEAKSIAIGGGITLNYVEQGAGVPVIFVHGSLSDYTYWQSQLGPFAEHYRAIAYSRRYNFPNHNPARTGYSAITDAEDLAALIRVLHLKKPFLGLVDAELTHLLPNNQRIVFPDAGHQMWLQHPEECRADAFAFFNSVR
jgi:pimeloyl-ACP methyl ester carboxylesterase